MLQLYLQTVLFLAPVVATFYYLFNSKRKLPFPCNADLAVQSVEVRKDASDESFVRRYTGFESQLLENLQDSSIVTLYHIFDKAARLYPTADCLGTRITEANGQKGPYKFRNYKEVKQWVDDFAAGLVKLGAKRGDRIGIYAKNREEWIIFEQACYRQSLIVVSFYDTLGEDAVEYIAKHSEARIVIVSKENASKLIPVAGRLPSLEVVIQMEPDLDFKSTEHYKAYSFADVTELGRNNPVPAEIPQSNDLSTIMYTSGTTGDPKGVMITHGNIIATFSGLEAKLNALCHPNDRYLSYLPLAHIFERVVVNAVLYKGGSIGFYQGDPRLLIDDILALRPAFFVGVPRVFDRIHDKIKATIEQGSPIKRFIFNTAYSIKRKALKEGKATPFWDLLVFNQFKSRLGGNVRALVSGSAPLTPAVHEFLLVCFGCPVLQGYGLTETCAGATIGEFHDVTVGHVGPPIACCEIKLADIPEMDYYTSSSPPKGEIALKGAHIAIGYYKDEAKTKEDFRDGWFYTGDVGQWNPNGTLSIIDRKKNIFKLSQGEYIAAEKIEGVLARCPFVGQIFVYGDSTKATLVAIVVPHLENLPEWAKKNSIEGDFKALCKNPAVNSMILKELDKTGKAAKLRGFEFVKHIHLHHEEFSTTNDLLTPTFKLRRPQLKAYFKDVLEKLYEGLE